MSGWAILLVGVVLCFLGVGSTHLAILASGFGLGWVLADVFGASAGTALTVAAAGAVISWVLVTLVFKVAAFFVGVITGSLIGARVAAVLTAGESNIAVTIVLVVAIAVAFGFLADRYRRRVLLWTTAIGGAGLMLGALGLIAPDTLGFLRDPAAGVEQVTNTLLWIGLAVAGWITQRALFPRALREERRIAA